MSDEMKRDNSMDLNALLKTATEVTGKKEETNEELSTTVGSNWWEITNAATEQSKENSEGPKLPDDNVSLASEEGIEKENEYDGPGLVVNTEDVIRSEQEEVKPVPPGSISPETMGYVQQYMVEMDQEIEAAKALAEQRKAEMEEENKEEDDETAEENKMTKDEFERAYKEAVVVIDKTGMGTIINFTDEEREKLEMVKKIKVEEIETVELKSIKTKKMPKKTKLENILKRQVNIHTTPIVLPASGYTAVMRGCSTYELISLMGNQQNVLIDTETKWSLIHSKLEETSIGKMEFNEFLLHTAAVDYNIFLYGLLCATYPDDDKIPLECKKCGKEFEHHYSIKSLIRAEKMSDKMKDLVMATVDSSHTAEMAKAHHNQAAVNLTKLIKLPVSGLIVELYVQSAYDFINKSIKELSENKDPKYNQASVLSSVIRRILIPDPDSIDGEYFEIDGAMDIAKTIYQLGDMDVLVLTKQGELILEDLSFEFGLMNVECPHCHNVTTSLPMDLESILFYKYQQAMTTKIE